MTVSVPYYMNDTPTDPRAENRCPSGKTASDIELRQINVERLHIDEADFEKQLDSLASKHRMQYRDEVNISRETMPNFEDKLKIFFEEHLHKDPEVRFIKAGSGYFDVRDANDKWIRIPVKAGDFLYLPAGLYHRFTTDENDNVIAIRLFQTEPKWEAYNRTADGESQAERAQFLHSIAADSH